MTDINTAVLDALSAKTNEHGPITYGEVIEGKIIKVNEDRGFGFIVSEERRFVRFFFHWTALKGDTLNFSELSKGMKVRFTESKTDRGHRAVQIEVLEDKES
jgi:cold shock CspA family protein